MSVLKSQQNLSRAEFVNVANEIFTETYQFLSRVSARYGRLLAPEICARASDVIDHCEMANKVLPTDKVKAEYREQHLLEALGAVSALGVKMAHLKRLLKIYRLVYALFGWHCSSINDFRGARE